MKPQKNYVVKMPNITLSVTDDFKERMDKHQHIRWSSAIRAVIEQLLDDFEEAERLAQKSGLTEEDALELGRKVNKAMGKRARELLNEHHHRR